MHKPIPPAIPLHPSVVPALSAFQQLPKRITVPVETFEPIEPEPAPKPAKILLGFVAAVIAIACTVIFLCLL